MQREYKEYIEREEAKELLRIWISDCVLDGDNDAADCYRDCIDLLDSIPTADVVEVRHGRWICINKRYGEYECSVCHGMDSNCSDYYGIHAVTEQEFCPSCGAKMDKEVADETCICQP